jgi:hypothetical protein
MAHFSQFTRAIKNVAEIGNNCDDGCGHFFENGLEIGCFLSCKERKVVAEFGILELLLTCLNY